MNPGKNFGPYGLPKTALLSLCKQYALDYGSLGIRSNGVNADRIRSGLLNDGMIKSRARAREVSTDEYMRGNLLLNEVKAEDVAKAFFHLAVSKKTTGAVLTVDGGNIAASLVVRNEDEIILSTDKGSIMRCAVKEIRVAGRNTQGVRIKKLSGNEKVVSVIKIEDNIQ